MYMLQCSLQSVAHVQPQQACQGKFESSLYRSLTEWATPHNVVLDGKCDGEALLLLKINSSCDGERTCQTGWVSIDDEQSGYDRCKGERV